MLQIRRQSYVVDGTEVLMLQVLCLVSHIPYQLRQRIDLCQNPVRAVQLPTEMKTLQTRNR